MFNLFLEKIMQETLYDHNTSTSIDIMPIFNLQFTDKIALMGSSKRLIDRAMAYGMEVNTEKSKITTHSMNNISADNSMEEGPVTSFKYLGATLSKDATAQQKSTSGLPQQ